MVGSLFTDSKQRYYDFTLDLRDGSTVIGGMPANDPLEVERELRNKYRVGIKEFQITENTPPEIRW